jgi:hypothetical protein
MQPELTKIAVAEDDDFVHDPPTDDRRSGVLAWQERAYFTMHGPDGSGLDIGCGRHPDAGETGSYSGYACLSLASGTQTNLRAAGPLRSRLGVPNAEPFRFEMSKPQTTWRILLEDNPGLRTDLTFEARTPMWMLPQTVISGKEGTIASTQVCFQSGLYHGRIETATETIVVDGWPGARDRTWGFRRFEGRLPSGLMIAAIFEFDDHALIMWSIERRTGERVVAHGARLRQDGTITPVENWSFDLDVDGDIGLLNAARLQVRDKDGEEEYEITPAGSTIYLAGGGYLEKGRHGQAASKTEIHTDAWNTANAEVRRAITGLDDHVVKLTGSREGSGILELQLGRHERYRPDGWPSLLEEVDQLESPSAQSQLTSVATPVTGRDTMRRSS